MREEELLKCQIHDWYPKFKPHTIKTLIHPLPPPFVSYLLDDDGPFLLPSSASGRDPLPRATTATAVSDPDDVSLFPPDSESDSDAESDSAAPSFPDLESEVENSIGALGGAAFPKLNWSSPKDAASIGVAGSLKCTTFAEIALLLKSSDAITHDLCHAFESCSDRSSESRPQFWLALRKWYGGLRPEMEFRCFVRRRCLVGVSQREVTTFYPVLVEKKRFLGDAIEMFFDEHVRPTFELEDYTFDVYVTGSGKVKVLDFNLWGGYTLPMLFEWEELEGEEFLRRNEEEVEFRIVESRRGVRPGLKTAVPFDYIDTGKGSGWEQLLNKAEEELTKQVQSS